MFRKNSTIIYSECRIKQKIEMFQNFHFSFNKVLQDSTINFFGDNFDNEFISVYSLIGKCII